eukprot:gb/GECH01011497.1/.p1 GENE.gb/GECH01011497.1/~~gb/GECH01011497.1/.p1  ORF type:complete len:193 (+),score=83.29 gb/GECH01011497.1/:1-579(+)
MADNTDQKKEQKKEETKEQTSTDEKTKLPAEHEGEEQTPPEQEHEDVIFSRRSKLFRFKDDEWKERGIGDVQLLKHKESKKTRLLMRREKTLKVCANHFIEPFMTLVKNVGSEKAFVWNSPADIADGESQDETFAIRFNNVENATAFKEAFNKAIEEMKELKETEDNNNDSQKEDEKKENEKKENEDKKKNE